MHLLRILVLALMAQHRGKVAHARQRVRILSSQCIRHGLPSQPCQTKARLVSALLTIEPCKPPCSCTTAHLFPQPTPHFRELTVIPKTGVHVKEKRLLHAGTTTSSLENTDRVDDDLH